jgi:hypothetical protein
MNGLKKRPPADIPHVVPAGAIVPKSGKEWPAERKAPSLLPSAKGQPELRILRVLAARHPARFTRAQWATLSGMKRTGGTWQTYVSRLRTSGFIDETDGNIALTPAGLAAAGHIDKPPPGSVVAQWKNALGSGPSKIIDVLLASYPSTVDRANVADRVGMVATGGTFQTYLSRLRSNGLIEVFGRKIKASPTLFLDQEQAA